MVRASRAVLTLGHEFPSPSLGREIQAARQVQALLLPRRAPKLHTLECAGLSLPAGGVGGDYYDYIQPSPGVLAVALGDVSGKGMPAALTMASLQASLRSHYALAPADLARRLEFVNRLLHECTPAGHYATLFLGEYDDGSRRLHYANCGHVPPLLARGDGRVERLGPTATMIGLFAEWECSTAEVTLAPGDTLLVFSDGVTEALGPQGEEFGEGGLLAALRARAHLPLPLLAQGIASDARRFAGGDPADDLTLVVARCRPGACEALPGGRADGRAR